MNYSYYAPYFVPNMGQAYQAAGHNEYGQPVTSGGGTVKPSQDNPSVTEQLAEIKNDLIRRAEQAEQAQSELQNELAAICANQKINNRSSYYHQQVPPQGPLYYSQDHHLHFSPYDCNYRGPNSNFRAPVYHSYGPPCKESDHYRQCPEIILQQPRVAAHSNFNPDKDIYSSVHAPNPFSGSTLQPCLSTCPQSVTQTDNNSTSYGDNPIFTTKQEALAFACLLHYGPDDELPGGFKWDNETGALVVMDPSIQGKMERENSLTVLPAPI
ncbi:hypothetical protein GYMLUDRAFT_253428 [Collybiopsis luxurians FD-317 M1]|uniref:Uncharacterized protein n=1 Tax=Collybiopsis luxurians FD-317 M1 TaxID=944289 RepID=A0A0D0BWM8_9AGAR|nr:hypothetical protein GYMLUDRAFT_253428 [Collybiopsis luxurians FD-317 M1]